MTENTPAANKRNIWIRGIYMLLMLMLMHATLTVLFAVIILQFVLTLLSEAPNARLITFSRSLARYVQQNIHFLTFATDDIPFPFSDWPAAE